MSFKNPTFVKSKCKTEMLEKQRSIVFNLVTCNCDPLTLDL